MSHKKRASKFATGMGVAILVASGLSNQAFAQAVATSTDVPVAPVVTPAIATPEVAPIVIGNNVKRLIASGNKLINDRLLALAKAKTRINASKLAADQKTTLATMIDQNSAGLTSLKSQIDVNTDASSTRVQVESIYTDFRIFAVFLPKIQLLSALGLQQNYSANLDASFVKVQSRIDGAKAKGVDVTSRQDSLNAASSTLATVKTNIAGLTATANSLIPANYPNTSKATISTVNAGIKSNTASFKTIAAKLKAAK